MNKTSYELVGFGTATLDYICLVDGLANYEQNVFIEDLKICGGGVVPTALVAFQRLGGKSSFISALGNDWIGNQIIKDIMLFATAVSSIKCTEYGGRKGIPGYKETMKFLNDRNISFDNY